MIIKNLTIFSALFLLVAGCGRQPEIRTYTEVVQMPEQETEKPPVEEAPRVRRIVRAAPLEVEPVPDNLPADHATFAEASPEMEPPLPSPGGMQADAHTPAADSPMSSAPGNPNAMVGRESEVPPPPEAGDLAWDLPPEWSARAGSGMRVAEFIPNDVPEGIVVTLIALGGPGGNVDANIARWRRQVGLSPAGESNVQTIQGKMPFTFMTLVDESQSASLPTSTIAAMYRLEDRSVFLKFMGPTDVVAAHKLDFLQLAGSLRVE